MFSKKILLKLFLFGSASILLFKPASINSETKENIYSQSQLLTSTKKDIKKVVKSDYILDTGDLINIIFIGLEYFSRNYIVDSEGLLKLPEIGEIYVRGLTLDELENKLIAKYKPYIFQPEFELLITQNRPIKVFLIGEIKKAGFYQFSSKPVTNLEDVGDIIISEQNNPTVFDAIKVAKGVTNYADISNIAVIRNNTISKGGGKIKAYINLLEMIETGDQSNNIFLRDGDSIVIPRSDQLIRDQILAINKTNINPNLIEVYVTGNVSSTGRVELPRGSTLVQAIASSGGKKLLSGNIEFLRFQIYGENDRRSFRYDPLAKANARKNPILMDGDIINVRKSILGNTTEILNEVSSPIFTIYGLFNLID